MFVCEQKLCSFVHLNNIWHSVIRYIILNYKNLELWHSLSNNIVSTYTI